MSTEHLCCPTIDAIQRAVAQRFHVTPLDLVSRRRGAACSVPRQVAMWLARYCTVCTLAEIGRAFGDRDHSTVINAIERTERIMAEKPVISSIVWELVRTVDEERSVDLRRSMMRVA
jgi:chromosomal replication initiator protein